MTIAAIFLVPAVQGITGGLISIFDIAVRSRAQPGVSVATLATYPGNDDSGRNDFIDPNEEILSFKDALEQCAAADELIIHIPEYSAEDVHRRLTMFGAGLEKFASVQLNILNQNIEMMPSEDVVANLLTITPHVTQTTAFRSYSTAELAYRYGVPVHHLSVGLYAEQFRRTDYAAKDNLVLVSPDPHPRRSELIRKLRDETNFEVIEVRDLPYPAYKELVSRAKFSVTFGEGNDGFFTDAFLSGGLGVTAYNDTFFEDARYRDLPTVYGSYGELVERAPQDLQDLDRDSATVAAANARATELIIEEWPIAEYEQGIADFYQHKYTFVPPSEAREKVLLRALGRRNNALATTTAERDLARRDLDEVLGRFSDAQAELAALTARHDELCRDLAWLEDRSTETAEALEEVLASKSWRITRPMRAATEAARRRLGRS